MASIRLPQAQLSELPPLRKKNSQANEILQVLGRNPYAEAIDVVSTDIAGALQKRAQLKKQGEQAAKISKIFDVDHELLSGLDPSTAATLGASISKARSEEKRLGQEFKFKEKQQEDLQKFRMETLKLKGSKASEGKPLPASLANQVSQGETALDTLSKARDNYKESFTGAIQGRLTSLENVPFAGKLPLLGKQIVDPKRATFNQNLEFGITKFLYSEAGKQLSDEEREYVRGVINDPSKDDKVFKARLDNALNIMEGANKRYKMLLRQTGYNVPEINLMGEKPPSSDDFDLGDGFSYTVEE